MRPGISILVTAFNHSRFVGEALQSVLAQETISPVEILVGVDRSTDATSEIVREIEHANPGRLRVVHHEQRTGLIGNISVLYREARGEIRALLEGDDYWTDPRKLEKQLRMLAEHPETVLCGHAVEQMSDAGGRLGTIPQRDFDAVLPSSEFVSRYCDMHTSSLVFRDVFGGELPPEVLDERLGLFDLPLKLALAARGGIAYLSEAMSVFRRVEGSASSGIDDEGWRDIVLRALANVDPLMTPELRRITRRQRVDLMVEGALSPNRSRSSRVLLALRSLTRQPSRAARRLARGAYAGLPEEAQSIYRRSRSAFRRASGG